MNISLFDNPNFNLSPLATWLATEGAIKFEDNEYFVTQWGSILALTALIASMVVNALVTGLIVFKILKVFLEVRATSVERTLGSLSSTGGTKLRHIIFIIIESGMALFAIQLLRVLVTSLVQFGFQTRQAPLSLVFTMFFIILIYQTLNVIIRSVLFFSIYFVLLMTFTCLGHYTNTNFGAGPNEIVLR